MLYFQTALNLHMYRPSMGDCTANAVERLDADGVWVSFIWRFPGDGQTYRVEPGEAVVLAVDATDHRVIHASLPDLRGAHFEFIGDPADPDNPGAANMIALRTNSARGNNLTNNTLIGVALPVARDTTELERRMLPNVSSPAGNSLFRVFRLPRSAVLDVGAFKSTPETSSLTGAYPREPFTSSVFDRVAAPLVSNVVAPMARKGLGFTGKGIEILQRTRTSERDFEVVDMLRRSLRRQ